MNHTRGPRSERSQQALLIFRASKQLISRELMACKHGLLGMLLDLPIRLAYIPCAGIWKLELLLLRTRRSIEWLIVHPRLQKVKINFRAAEYTMERRRSRYNLCAHRSRADRSLDGQHPSFAPDASLHSRSQLKWNTNWGYIPASLYYTWTNIP